MRLRWPASAGGRGAAAQLRSFLHERMYCHYKVRRMQRTARQVVASCSRSCSSSPTACRRTGRRAPARRATRRPQAIADYIAGMTDRFALDEHDRLFTLMGGAR